MVNREAIVSIVKGITEREAPPCKKSLQKIVFLIEAKGIPLGCDYGIHFYGPYSADLDYAVKELSDEGILEIEYTGTQHKISVKDETMLAQYADDTVRSVLQEFANDKPSELELLTTALFVYLESNKDTSKILDGVIKIKGNKYSQVRIQEAITRLKKTGYIAA